MVHRSIRCIIQAVFSSSRSSGSCQRRSSHAMFDTLRSFQILQTLFVEHIHIKLLHDLDYDAKVIEEAVDGYTEHSIRCGLVFGCQYCLLYSVITTLQGRGSGETERALDEWRKLLIDGESLKCGLCKALCWEWDVYRSTRFNQLDDHSTIYCEPYKVQAKSASLTDEAMVCFTRTFHGRPCEKRSTRKGYESLEDAYKTWSTTNTPSCTTQILLVVEAVPLPAQQVVYMFDAATRGYGKLYWRLATNYKYSTTNPYQDPVAVARWRVPARLG
nr:hypothetical protein CFP56_76041 [Quercus suber]